MKTARRPCPVCSQKKSTDLYIQKFSNHFSHTISECFRCGFLYVSTIPPHNYYDTYYRNSSKYDINREEWFHTTIVRHLSQHVTKNQRILDVGCATGHLLSLLKTQGYRHILGIDPSPKSKIFARKTFGVTVNTADIYTYSSPQKYSVVILSAVLEHLADVRGAIKQVTEILTDDGLLYICVPDAGTFHTDVLEPYGEFSTEHINFFSQESLFSFMGNFKNKFIESDGKVIYSLWQKTPLRTAMEKYITKSNEQMKKVDTIISHLPDNLVVWGAGALTQRLLETTPLAQKVLFFVDKDTKLYETKLKGKPIRSPDILQTVKNPIFIVSYKFKDEIIKEIQSRKLSSHVFSF